MTKVIRLADYEQQQLPTVVLRNGRELAVHGIDGGVLDLRDEYVRTQQPVLLWQMAARILPDAKEEEIKSLSISECSAVIQIAAGETPAPREADSRAPTVKDVVAAVPQQRTRRRVTRRADAASE